MQERKPKLHADWIDPQAIRIVTTLQREGFETYLVGGCVRDLLVGIHPKDFDIATSAHPPQVKRLINRSNIIGRRFRLVLVRRYDAQFEVSTFRRNQILEELESEAALPAAQEDPLAEQPVKPILNDNFFGTAQEDACRRDFTVNALFYDPSAGKIVDYCEGLKDIEQNLIRMIGDPYQRFVEDPIRILRAIRLAHKIGFKLEPSLRAAIPSAAIELGKSVLPRRREEYLKILKLSDPLLALIELYDLKVMGVILPTLAEIFSKEELFSTFVHYFTLFQLKSDSADSMELFSGLVMSFLRAKYHEKTITIEELDQDRELLKLMKDELGMFKAESMTLFKAIELMPSLQNVDYFLRKGERRRRGFVKSEGFGLALAISEIDFALSPVKLNFWKTQAHQH